MFVELRSRFLQFRVECIGRNGQEYTAPWTLGPTHSFVRSLRQRPWHAGPHLLFQNLAEFKAKGTASFSLTSGSCPQGIDCQDQYNMRVLQVGVACRRWTRGLHWLSCRFTSSWLAQIQVRLSSDPPPAAGGP